MPESLLLLAGGQARRLGRPKETLPWAGTTLIENSIARLRPRFGEVLVATAHPERLPASLGVRIVSGERRDGGPLAGLEAGLEAAHNEVVLALACDLPYVDGELLEVLVDRLGRHDAVVPFVGARPDPLCAVYRKRSLEVVTRLLDAVAPAGRPPSLRALLASLDVRYFGSLEFRLHGFEERLLWNLNTPGDYQLLITGA